MDDELGDGLSSIGHCVGWRHAVSIQGLYLNHSIGGS